MSEFRNFYVERSPWNNYIRVCCSSHRYELGGKAVRIVAKEPEWVEVEGGILDQPTMMKVSEAEAQQLMDALWSAGLRPTEGRGSAGAMAAVQEHLADMRRLVFGKDES